jgi:UDP-2,3-diacylglucosamine pyrophosphatase LpxH
VLRRRASRAPQTIAADVLARHGLVAGSAVHAMRRSYRAVFVSDVHLGSRASKAGQLLDFLGSVECEQLYLVGDIIDEWKLRGSAYWPREHAEVLRQVGALAAGGVEVTYVSGNHDASLRVPGGRPPLAGLRCAEEALHRCADGRELLVLHGDLFDPHSDGGSLVVRAGEKAYDLAMGLNAAYNGLARLVGAEYRSLSLALKQRVKEAVRAIQRFEEGVVSEARQRGIDGVVCGHIHKAELRTVEGFLYANDGDWVESCTALVEHHDGRLELVQWREGRVVPLEAGKPIQAPDPRRSVPASLRVS